MNGGPSGIVLIVRRPARVQTLVVLRYRISSGDGAAELTHAVPNVLCSGLIYQCDYLTNARELSILLLSCN